MSTSLIDNLVLTWRRQRYSHALWWPVAITMSTASMLAMPPNSSWWGLWMLRTVIAWLALGGLRLLDDLQDLDHDRTHYPERVLTQTNTHTGAWGALLGALLLCFGLLFLAKGSPLGFAAMLAAFGVFYRVNLHTYATGSWLRLLKYPALVVILAGGLVPPVALVMVYAGVCLDELLQEAGGRRIHKACAGTTLWLAAIFWCVSWWGPPWRNVLMSTATCMLPFALTLAITRHPKGMSFHTLRGCFLGVVLLLLALPQVVL